MKRLLKVSPETKRNGFDDQFEVCIATYRTDTRTMNA